MSKMTVITNKHTLHIIFHHFNNMVVTLADSSQVPDNPTVKLPTLSELHKVKNGNSHIMQVLIFVQRQSL